MVAKPEIAFEKGSKTVYGLMVEAHESTRKRVESSRSEHEGHIACKGFTSMSVPMRKVMKIPGARAAVDKEWKKLETIPALNLDKVRSKKEVILEAQRDKQKVHFATLMDTCHLKNAELEPKLQMHKGRVLLRGDIVKDDSGAYAIFY